MSEFRIAVPILGIPAVAGSREPTNEGPSMDVIGQTRTQGAWTVVEVAGELDLHTSPPLREHMLELIDGGTDRLALDMTRVDFMDSSSLGSLVMCLKRIRERDGRMVLAGVAGTPMKVLNLTGLDRVFELADSLAELPED
jgi:anti-sigma B factor antagonist